MAEIIDIMLVTPTQRYFVLKNTKRHWLPITLNRLKITLNTSIKNFYCNIKFIVTLYRQCLITRIKPVMTMYVGYVTVTSRSGNYHDLEIHTVEIAR